jgi:ParB family chromosome partitioning protein
MPDKKQPQSTDELVDILLPAGTAGKTATPKFQSKSREEKHAMSEQIQNINVTKLTPFENHPFQVRQDEDFQKLVESIKENGVLIPIIARPKGDGYELIAGHRRKLAAAIAGLSEIPIIVRELTDEQAVIAMVDSNVQRENVLPSEKAFAYKMKLDALKMQGKRSDLTSCQLGARSRSDHLLAENANESARTIQRYIRLTELIPQLLQMVDERKIAFNPAVELSHLPKEQQTLLLSAMEAEQSTPSLAQAQKFKTMSAEGRLTEDSMMEVMREQKGNQKEQVKIPYDRVREIIKRDMPPKELEDFILKAVADYQKKLIRQRQDRDAR